jgi:chemotaxis protein MotB
MSKVLGTFLVLALAGGGAAGGYAWKVDQARKVAVSDASTLGKQLASCRGDLDTEKSAATAASATLTATATELDALRKQRAETDKRLASFKEMTEKFRKMIDSGKLEVIHRNGRMVVKLPAGVLFASGSAELSQDGQRAISDVAAVLKEFKDRKFLVAGHTDNVPLKSSPFKDNWELSTARAVTVTAQLITAGMTPAKLAAAGYSEYEPIRANNNEAGRKENRRIEIVLLPNLAELPPIAEGPAD